VRLSKIEKPKGTFRKTNGETSIIVYVNDQSETDERQYPQTFGDVAYEVVRTLALTLPIDRLCAVNQSKAIN
jgi:hypothetical protein